MDAKNLEITYSFSRLSNGPLDKSSHFNSQDDLENAYIHSTSTSSPFYDGEVVTVSDSNGGTAYVYQNYNGQTHLDPIILNSEFNCSIVSNTTNYIEASNEQALKITNKYADDSAQKIDTSSIVNLKFVGKCTTADINDRTSAFWASTPGNVWFISESFEIDSKHYKAYSHIICIAGPMSTVQNFHDRFSVLGPVDWHSKTLDAYIQDECNTKYMYKENILDDVISQESKTLFGKLTNAVFSSLETNKTEFNVLRNIYGKSLVWNQLIENGNFVEDIANWSKLGVSVVITNNVATLTTLGTGTHCIYQSIKVPQGHKVLFRATIWGNTGFAFACLQSSSHWLFTFYNESSAARDFYTIVESLDSVSPMSLQYRQLRTDDGTSANISNVMCIDLTLMFGAGNEPATVEEFKEMFPNYYYPYNAGEIISNKTEKLEMTGFNKWDEEWEVGIYDSTTGEKKPYLLAIRSKNYIGVLPDAYYYFQSPTTSAPYGRVLFYDTDYNYIDSTLLDTRAHRLWQTPSNCSYITFYMVALYGTTYNHDICINISDPNKNGTYEPYKHNDLLLNLTTLTGKLNGIGERVTIFPDGMSSAGNVHDELIVGEDGNAIAHKLIHKLKIADVTGLDGGVEGTRGAIRYVLFNNLKKTGLTSFLSNFFVQKNGAVTGNDDGWLISGYASNNIIYLTIPVSALSGDLTTASGRRTAFRNWWDANNPVILIELATPLIYTDLQYADQIDIPLTLPVRYIVDNFGTEEIVVPNSTAGEPTSCAPTITIKYNANTIDQNMFIYRTTGGNTDVESGYAYIEEVQGNEIVWNQGFNPTTAGALSGAGVTAVKNTNGTFTLNGNGSAHANIITRNHGFVAGHKYFFAARILSKGSDTSLTDNTHGQIYGQNIVNIQTNLSVPVVIGTANGTGDGQIRWHIITNDVYDNVVVAFTLIDLTLASYPNIATTTPTVAEVEAWLAQYVGFKNYYPYDAGTLLPMKMKAMRTIGFNQWDEQWEVGGYDLTTGAKKVSTVTIRSKEYIPIFPNTIYYCNASKYGGTYAIRLFYYDANKNFLSTVAAGNTFTTPVGAYYMNFTLRTEYGITYNNDICINLQKDGSRNGDYEHYWTKEAEFNVMEITGINSNTGQRETIFPNGMCGKGDWADVIYHDGDNTIAVKKTGRVDLGSMTWGDYVAPSSTIPYGYSITSIIGKSNGVLNLLSSGYLTKYSWSPDKSIRGNGSNATIYVIDSSLQDKTRTQIKAAMLGVMLDYELATPIIYTDLQYVDGRPFNQLWFNTYKDGLIIQNPQAPLSVPMNMDYEKPYDMPAEYICMDSFDALLDQLGNSMGGTWTKTYNEETQAYEFRFTTSN